MSRICPTVVSMTTSGVPLRPRTRYRLLYAKANRALRQPGRADLAKAAPRASVQHVTEARARGDAASAINGVRRAPVCTVVAPDACPARADMPEADLHTEGGQLRRDMVAKVLERIEVRLAHMANAKNQSRMIRVAATREWAAVHALARDLALSPRDPGAGAVPAGGDASPGLDAEGSEKLLRVLRGVRKAIYAPPSFRARLWQALGPGAGTPDCTVEPDAVLEMLLRHMEVQILGGWAALVRVHVQAVQTHGYQDYECPGNGESSFLGTTADMPVGSPSVGITPGVIAGMTILGRDLGACEDGSVEQSSWWSMTLGASLTAGIAFIKARLGLSVSVKRTEGFFFEDVDQLVASPEGLPHRQRVADATTRRLKRAMGANRGPVATGLALKDLVALQERAYAEREIFAKVLGPIAFSADAAGEALHMVRITRAASAMPGPSAFQATEARASADLSGTAGVPGLMTGTVKVAGEAIFKQLAGYSRKGFWQAVRHLELDDGASLTPAERERVGALQASAGRVATGLGHLRVALGRQHPRAAQAPGEIPGAARSGGAIDAVEAINAIEGASASELAELLSGMEREFDRYCYSRTQVAAGLRRHEAQARAIESAWGARGPDAMYAYVQALAIALALIGLCLKAMGEGDHAALDRLDHKLQAPDMVDYDARKAQRYTTFRDETDLLEYSFPISLHAGLIARRDAGIAGIGGTVGMSAGVAASVQALTTWRCDANTLRAGRYLRISFDVSVLRRLEQPVPAIGEFLRDHAARLGLDNHAIGPGVEGLGDVLRNYLIGTVEASVRSRVTLCYYQPRGANAIDGLRLQYARLTCRSAAPGVESSRLRGEKLGTDTLSYLFMRHHAYASRAGGTGAPYWSRFCARHRGSIESMLAKLADPDHPIGGEARHYWNQIVEAADPTRAAQIASMRAAFFGAMETYARAPGEDSFHVARAALDELAALHMLPWQQSLREHVHSKAHIQLAA